MRLELTESVKKFINTLNEADLSKAIITDDTFESDDPVITDKLEKHIKNRFSAVGEKINVATERFRSEHPEYFS